MLGEVLQHRLLQNKSIEVNTDMSNKNIELNNSRFNGNLVQGDVGGNVTAKTQDISKGPLNNNAYNNDFREATIGNFANQLSDNAKQEANQYFHLTKEEKTLAEALKEIQELLKQLEAGNPTATEAEKIAFLSDQTSPSFKRRVVAALKAAGETSIEEFLDNPYVNVAKATVKGWVQAQ